MRLYSVSLNIPLLSAMAETVMPESLIFSLSKSTFATVISPPFRELYSLYHSCEFVSTLFHNFVELFYTSCYYMVTQISERSPAYARLIQKHKAKAS